MCNRGREAGAGLAVFVLGALVGAALGVLYAPAKGETTRKKLKRWANDTYEENKEYMLEHAQDLKEKVKGQLEDAREKLSEGKDKVLKELTRRKDEVVAKLKKEEKIAIMMMNLN